MIFKVVRKGGRGYKNSYVLFMVFNVVRKGDKTIKTQVLHCRTFDSTFNVPHNSKTLKTEHLFRTLLAQKHTVVNYKPWNK